MSWDILRSLFNSPTPATPPTTYLIVGLGNPGKQYQATRHNIGWQVIDELATQLTSEQWHTDKKSNSLALRCSHQQHTIHLIKPLTFMNKSGSAVQAASAYYTIPPEHIWVIHDELDLPFGTIKLAQHKSAAGHNGVQSIIQALQTKAINRVRIGIGRPTTTIPIETYVLQRFSAAEKSKLTNIIQTAITALLTQVSTK